MVLGVLIVPETTQWHALPTLTPLSPLLKLPWTAALLGLPWTAGSISRRGVATFATNDRVGVGTSAVDSDGAP